jgi:nitrite reductase/ring-hydroxylating ferredoxin subunit
VAAQYHTARFRLVPQLAKALSVPVPPLRKPGSAWTELPRPPAADAVPAGRVRIGYARASTVRQSLDTQADSLRACQGRRSPSSVPRGTARGGPATYAHRAAPAPGGHRARCGRGRCAIGNAGGWCFAVTCRCRRLGAEFAGGRSGKHGCLCAPWHRSALPRGTGQMVRGPQGSSLRCQARTWGVACSRGVLLGQAAVTERGGKLYLGG